MNQLENVKVFGLVNGMEIIGTIESESDSALNLKDALLILVDDKDPTKAVVRFHPPANFGEGGKAATMTLYKGSVLFSYMPRQDLYQGYCTTTGSVIIASGMIQR